MACVGKNCGGPTLGRGPPVHDARAKLVRGPRSDSAQAPPVHVVVTPSAARSATATARISASLEAARRQARRHVLRATVLPGAVGLALAYLSLWLCMLHVVWHRSPWFVPLANAVGVAGVTGCLFACDPTSELIAPAFALYGLIGSNALWGCALGYVALAKLAPMAREPAACGAVGPFLLGPAFVALWAAACLVGSVLGFAVLAGWRRYQLDEDPPRTSCGVRPLTTRWLVEGVWIAAGFCTLGLGLAELLVVSVKVARGDRRGAGPEGTMMLVCALATGAWWSSSTRARLHALLLAGAEPIAVAAGIATLLGGSDTSTVQNAIVGARERFRAIPFRALDESSLDPRVPPGRAADFWYRRSAPCSVDSCDAFISHSWHDPPREKWAALQAWAASFQREHLREPLVWLDRACIDQTNVQDDLKFLPIYLAACKQLVILAGGSYLTRMWCIVELHVFTQMWPATPQTHSPLKRARVGGRRASTVGASTRVVMMLLPDARADLFGAFDAAQARCAEERDYDRLLRCVEIGCGSVESFNARARLLLASAVHVPHKPRASAGELALANGSAGRSSAGAAHAQRPDGRTSAAAGRPATQPRQSSSGGPSQSTFAALARLWVRAYALALVALALGSAHVLVPALADCIARADPSRAAGHRDEGGISVLGGGATEVRRRVVGGVRALREQAYMRWS